MRRYYSAFILCLLAPQLVLAQWTEGQEGQLLIRGGWLFDSVSNERRPNTGIVIQNGKIVEVDADAEQQVPSAAEVIDLAETDTILPGMIDLHAHYNFDLVDNGRVEEVIYNGIVFLANGVTSTWSAGEFFPERVLSRRDLVDAGKAIGPRIFSSGPYFGGFRCEYSVKTAADDCPAWPNDITEEEIRTEVDAIDDFPEDVEDPIIKELGSTERVLDLLVAGPMTTTDLKAYCEDLKLRLQQLPEIAIVQVRGFSDHQLRIELSREAVMQFGISAADVADVVARQNLN